MPIDPARFEQFFRRNSSGDWVYVGYGPDFFGRVISSYDRDWLLEALPKLCRWKRWTVALFSAPLVWLFAVFMGVVTKLPATDYSSFVFRNREVIAMVALVLLLCFLGSTAVIALQPVAKEFGKVLSGKPKDEPVGVEKFLRNVGAVNGPWVTSFLFLGFGALVTPGAIGPFWPYFLPFTLAWAWMAWHAWAGALWKPQPDDF